MLGFTEIWMIKNISTQLGSTLAINISIFIDEDDLVQWRLLAVLEVSVQAQQQDQGSEPCLHLSLFPSSQVFKLQVLLHNNKSTRASESRPHSPSQDHTSASKKTLRDPSE